MADTELADLNPAGTIDGTELAYLVQSSNDRKAALSALRTYFVSTAAEVEALLEGISFTDIGTPASGDQILIRDVSDSNALKTVDFSEFGGGGASELSDLSDVATSTPTDRFALMGDGTDFESRALVEADISDLGTYQDDIGGATLTDVGTPASGDLILLQDASDSKNLKTALFSEFGGGGVGGSGGVVTDTYTTTGGSDIDIDISDCDVAVILIDEMGCSVSSRPSWRLSTDGGTTQESGSVYRQLYETGSTQTYVAATSLNIGVSDGAKPHTGILRLEGHQTAGRTGFFSHSGDTSGSTNAAHRNGVVDTTDVYDTIVFTPGAGTFDSMQVTVHRYSFGVATEAAVIDALDGATTTAVTPAAGDKVLLLDASDSDNLKHSLYSDFGGGSVAVSVVTTTGTDEVVIDLSDCDWTEIMIDDLICGSSTRQWWRASTDGGTTSESGSVYQNFFLTDGNDSNAVGTEMGLDVTNGTSTKAILKIGGHGLAGRTFFMSSSGDTAGHAIRNGYIDTTDAYDSIVISNTAASNFTTTSITVIKYSM